METFEQRLQRFKNGPPTEFMATILNSIDNVLVPELGMASKNKLSNILILGVHSTIETISEYIFLKNGVNGFKFYLENFVDADKEGFRFSEIADELNSWRNIIAHQWISCQGHSFGYDYDIKVGYQKANDNMLILNPSIFLEQFKSAFDRTNNKTKRRIWDYGQLLNQGEMEKAKARFIQKFKNY